MALRLSEWLGLIRACDSWDYKGNHSEEHRNWERCHEYERLEHACLSVSGCALVQAWEEEVGARGGKDGDPSVYRYTTCDSGVQCQCPGKYSEGCDRKRERHGEDWRREPKMGPNRQATSSHKGKHDSEE